MMLESGIKEIDVHNMKEKDAVCYTWRTLKKANDSVYQVKVIHGYNHGTKIRDALVKNFGSSNCRKIKNMYMGNNPGVTIFILRNLY